MPVQIFGIKGSQAARAAERFFKERRVEIQYVDLNKKAMAFGEIKRFIDKFGMTALLDTESKAYKDAGLQYLKLSPEELLARIEKHPGLLKLPFVRGNNKLSIGHDEEMWKQMVAPPAKP
jgi:arsenate reductase-like glutaredoxin family protein